MKQTIIYILILILILIQALTAGIYAQTDQSPLDASTKSANENTTRIAPNITIDPYLKLFPVEAKPSNSQNYIKTRTYTSAYGEYFMDAVQYYDGLGRPNQLVQTGITPGRNDLISIQEYDGFGREGKSWLPAPLQNNTGKYYTGVPASLNNSDGNPYFEPKYEPSPLNRIEKQYGPGQAWRTANRFVGIGYKTNTASDCAYYSVSGNSLVRNGYYAANTLYVTQVTDEDNKISYEYKDKLGKIVLQRQMNSTTPYNTYYIYDDFGNLRFVLSPEAANGTTSNTTYSETHDMLKQYAYQYRYDDRQRCNWKRLPGCEPVNYRYDTADRLILTQDGELPANRWLFSIPDALGRTVLQGIGTGPVVSGVVKASFSTNAAGVFAAYGYNISGISMTEIQVLQVNYYDNYQFKSLPGHFNNNSQYTYTSDVTEFEDKWYGTDNSGNNGLLTGSITGLLDDSLQLHAVHYYDYKSRVIQSISQNHLSGFEKEYINYSFTGRPVWKRKIHSALGQTTIDETYKYYYDHAERLGRTEYKIDNATDIILSEPEYDDLGRVAHKKLHRGVETIDYSYNIRSWLSDVNSAHFKENLYYESTVAGSTASYNGNISAMLLPAVSGISTQSRGYTYTYDGTNRLLKAQYVENNAANGKFTEEYGYDGNGNMNRLIRNTVNSSSYKNIDDLTITYNGNQLKSVSDAVPASTTPLVGFIKPGNTAVEYTYNKNGAITQDFNRKIAGISYNLLNLPERIQFMDGHNTRYKYDASGKKRKVIHETALSTISVPLGTTNYTPASQDRFNVLTTDYCGNIVYENGNLKYILTEEGYLDAGRTPHYYLKDHLGNNRVVVAVTNNTTVQITQANNYYPFGLPFEETYSFGNGEEQPYKFGGKEYDEMHGLKWYDFEARHKDAILPVFSTMDPLAEKYYSVSPYAYCNNNPMNRIDPTGLDSYMVFYSIDDKRFKAAAETRKQEIENMKSFNSSKDHVYMVEIGDLGTLRERVNGLVKDATNNDYGMTVETSFYTHGGADGPIGDVATSGDYNLKNATGNIGDNKQLTSEGWSNINWNFNPDNSVAAFYGCQTAGFAERFFDYSNVQYTAGQAARVGPSSSATTFNSIGYFSRTFGTNSPVYYGDNIGGNFYGVTAYGRNVYSLGRERKMFEIGGNVGVRGGQLYQYRLNKR